MSKKPNVAAKIPDKAQGAGKKRAGAQPRQQPCGPRVSLSIKIEGLSGKMLEMSLLEILRASGPGGGGEDGDIGGG